MTIELNLQQAEGILNILSKEVRPSLPVQEAMTSIKRTLKRRVEIEKKSVGRLEVKMMENGYKDEEMFNLFNKLKSSVEIESQKTIDRYFDADGNEKLPGKK